MTRQRSPGPFTADGYGSRPGARHGPSVAGDAGQPLARPLDRSSRIRPTGRWRSSAGLARFAGSTRRISTAPGPRDTWARPVPRLAIWTCVVVGEAATTTSSTSRGQPNANWAARSTSTVSGANVARRRDDPFLRPCGHGRSSVDLGEVGRGWQQGRDDASTACCRANWSGSRPSRVRPDALPAAELTSGETRPVPAACHPTSVQRDRPRPSEDLARSVNLAAKVIDG